MRRWAFFSYGFGCYFLFLVTYAALCGFVGNLLPTSIDAGRSSGDFEAFVVNLGLMGLFAIQHSVMARPAFKRIWTRVVPKEIERSTYVLLSCVVIGLMIWLWRPIGGTVWNLETPFARGIAWGLFAIGWLAVPLISLMIDHFDLFGLRQVWLHLKRSEYRPLPFRVPLAYRVVRHPLYVGWALAFWATPNMSVGHLLFASTLTLYMVLAVRLEERDLIDHYGAVYENYRRSVPMFVPRLPAKVAGLREGDFVQDATPSLKATH